MDSQVNPLKTWITYEEVIDATTSSGLYTNRREVSRQNGRISYDQEKRYTLDMVRIDDKIRQVINHIKLAEAKEANLT